MVQQSRSTKIRGVDEYAATFVLMATIVAGLYVVILRFEIVPPHFSYDGLKIQRLAQAAITHYEDQSYGLVAAFYANMGLAHYPTLAGIVGYALGVAAIVRALRGSSRTRSLVLAVALSALAIMLSAVYLGYYSKDVFVLPIVLMALSEARSSRATNILVVSGMFLYGYFFRQYWILVGIAFVVYILVLPKLRNLGLVVAFVLSGVCTLSFAIFFVLGMAPDGYRNLVNEDRVGTEDASTAILPFTQIPQPLGGVVNNILTAVSFAVPIPLIALGGAYYALVAVVFVIIWASLIRGASCMLTDLKSNIQPSGGRVRALCFTLAFVTVQAVFEPDFGSALRHLTPLLPLVVHLVASSARADRGSRKGVS